MNDLQNNTKRWRLPTVEEYQSGVATFFDGIEFTIEETNDMMATAMTRLLPMVAPLPSAVAIYMSLTSHLDYNLWIALPAAAAIEGLGFATADLAIKCWSHNRRADDAHRAPFGAAVAMFAVYLVTALALVTVLEVWPEMSRFAPGGFPFLTVVGALNLAINLLVRELKAEMAQPAKRSRKSGNIVETSEKTAGNVEAMNAARNEKIRKRRTEISNIVSENGPVSVAEISALLSVNVSEKTITADLAALATDGVVAKIGKRWELVRTIADTLPTLTPVHTNGVAH